jgi:release factor glutamine methyltransferase
MIKRQEEKKAVWSVAELLRWTTEYFERLALPSARLDAEILLAAALGKQRLDLYTCYNMLVEPAERARFRVLVERRARKEPVAYITGRREFYSLAFEVSPAVLVPRPETEHLVELALRRLPAGPAPLRLLDLGTGSGCIAVAIAVNAPHAGVDAVDFSAPALEVARRNADAHGVEARIRFLEGDLYGAVPAGTPPYRAIVSNPPYIPASEHAALMADVREFEPREALVDTRSPTSDGLGFYRAIAAGARERLEPGGLLAVEVGAGQAQAVAEILRSAGLTVTETLRDLGGIDRVVAATTD